MNEKTKASIAIFVFMVAVLLFNAVFSARENYLEGFTLDISGTGQKLLSQLPIPVQQPPVPAQQPPPALAAVQQQIQTAKATQEAAATQESFENLFDAQYASANNWSSIGSDDVFKGVSFKPACCAKSEYSNSSGCACLSANKIKQMTHGN
jgi:hypothetical protein